MKFKSKIIIALIVLTIIIIVSLIFNHYKNSIREDNEILVTNKINIERPNWVFLNEKINKEFNPALFDFTHNSFGLFSDSDKVPNEDYIIIVIEDENYSEIVFDSYITATAFDDEYPPFGHGIVSLSLDKYEENSLRSWIETNNPEIKEELLGNIYSFYVLTSEKFNFENRKINVANIEVKYYNSGAEETTDLKYKKLQQESYMKKYLESFGIPTEWIRSGRESGKIWLLNNMPDPNNVIFDKFNYEETIYVPSKRLYEEYLKNNKDSKIFINKIKDRKTYEDLVIVSVNGNGRFIALGSDYSEGDLNSILKSNGYEDLNVGKILSQEYMLWLNKISDEIRY